MGNFNKIISTIEMINKQNYKKNDNIIKEFIKFVFESYGEINEGVFEFIYDYAIKESLINLYNFVKENNLCEEIINSSLLLSKIDYIDEGSKLKIFFELNVEKNDSFMIDIDFLNKEINIFCLNKYYYILDEKIEYYEYPRIYKYNVKENDKIEVLSLDAICECYFNKDGLMDKKEITIIYEDAFYREYVRKKVFINYYLEQKKLKVVQNLFLDLNSKLDLLPLVCNNKIKIIFERDKECFITVNKSYHILIDDIVIYKDNKEIYLRSEKRLYDLNNFNTICSNDEDYLKGIEKEENRKLKETYLRRLRSLD